MDFEARLLGQDSVDAQVEVYCKSFSRMNSHESVKDDWIKKHFRNPIHESYIFGVFDGDLLISINAYMPLKYRFADKECLVLQSCESGTLPEYRGKGIWSNLVKYAVAYFKEEGVYDFLLGFPNYNNSYAGFIKMQWNHDADIENYIMVNNEKMLLSCFLGIRAIPFTRIIKLQHLKVWCKKNKKLSVCECKDNIADTKGDIDSFILLKDDAFITWKSEYKGLQQFGLCNSRREYVASCSYALGNYKGKQIVNLYSIEVVNEANNLEMIYATCIYELLNKYKEAAFIRTWVMKECESMKMYRKLMFLKSKHHNPFITKLLKDDIVTEEQIKAKTNWRNLCFMDLD